MVGGDGVGGGLWGEAEGWMECWEGRVEEGGAGAEGDGDRDGLQGVTDRRPRPRRPRPPLHCHVRRGRCAPGPVSRLGWAMCVFFVRLFFLFFARARVCASTDRRLFLSAGNPFLFFLPPPPASRVPGWIGLSALRAPRGHRRRRRSACDPVAAAHHRSAPSLLTPTHRGALWGKGAGAGLWRRRCLRCGCRDRGVRGGVVGEMGGGRRVSIVAPSPVCAAHGGCAAAAKTITKEVLSTSVVCSRLGHAGDAAVPAQLRSRLEALHARVACPLC